jgi:hypothetical protein
MHLPMTNATLAAAKIELELARSAAQRMEEANTLEDFDFQWKQFLGRIRRVWYKTLAAFKGNPRFFNSAQYKRVNEALTSDELVCYLAKARDADEHTVEDITQRVPSGWAIPLSGGGHLVFHEPATNGQPNGFSPDLNPHAVFQPERIAAAPATTKGRTYPVPKWHEGNAIESRSILTFARLGLAYYAKFLDRLEAGDLDPR